MSLREFPSEDSEIRQDKAEDIEITDIREVDGAAFGAGDYTVYEIDAVNESGETRENRVVIPRILFENTKDVQYRHEQGIIGKYTLALCQESEEAMGALQKGIEEKRNEIEEEITELREKDSRLLHTQADLDNL
jgi:hypothetical protein